MAKSVILKKKVANILEDIYPKTLATNVYMSDGTTSLQTYLDNLETTLNLNQVYMTDNNSAYMVDSDGTKLVAIY